ncbi:MAG: ComF family protein [Deltaproteobacteria bacterium]|nr:ComF family protein [Deltaproteobacteria bacterium]
MILSQISHFALNLFWPLQCLECRTLIARGDFCDRCEPRFSFLQGPCCPLCSLPFDSSLDSDHLCSSCLEVSPPFARTIALGVYKELLHEMIIRMKYHQEERVAEFFGERLARKMIDEQIKGDWLIPVPLHPKRLRERGFNQAVVMSKVISRVTGIPFSPFLLRRVRDTSPQTGLEAVDRKKNMKGAFQVEKEALLEGKQVILIDDVYTTGATLRECGKVLKKAGAVEINVCVAARTP